MKKLLSAVALVSVAGFANASEPMHLSDSQMDTVSAGGMESLATTEGSAKYGKTLSIATTSATSNWYGKRTTATAGTLAVGYKVTSAAAAGSSF
ncbi:hypothetical protein [Noviherbaspirillum malthae]|uniref:hypothetical protein n=1 Tax=Noviherbaspirillum malthae TaxID=1260987 RepID=UPI00188E2363|nr:hypothetical protein [Noviherbaspirillum malthae]